MQVKEKVKSGQAIRNNNIAFKDIYSMSQEDITKKLNKTIDNIYKGIMPIGNQVVFKNVPSLLRRLGVHNNPILISPNGIRNSVLSKKKQLY